MIGKLKDIIPTRSGDYIISFTTRSDFREEFDRLKEGEIDIEIKKHSKKRSLDANAYLWVLCGKLAETLQKEAPKVTKDGVYRRAIREVGIYQDIEINTEAVKTLNTLWKSKGVGWFTEMVDEAQDAKKAVVRCYYGSSTYNARQMGRLIDYLIEDCRALGIPTESPEEIEKIKSLWANAPKKQKA